MSKTKSAGKRTPPAPHTTIRMRVTVAMGAGEFQAHEAYEVPVEVADELVRLNAAQFAKTQPPASAPSGARADTRKPGPGDAWRQTIRAGDAFPWQVTLPLPRFEKPSIHRQFEPRLHPANGNERRARHRLREVGGEGARPSPAQARAVDYLLVREATLYARLLDALARYAAGFRAGWVVLDRALADRVAPRGMGRRKVAERIAVRSVYLPRRARDGIGYVEFHGECAWDRDRGYCVVMHRERVVDVMPQGTGWRDTGRH